jgi:hypothetical protein
MVLMINHTDTQRQKPQPEKLVLPAQPDEAQQSYKVGQTSQIQPEQLIRYRPQPAPKGAVAKLIYYWRKDPAYKVLIIAMVVVLLAGVAFVSLASAAFIGNANFFTSRSSQNPPIGANPTGTVDLRPSFPTPGGGSGSNQSSQPPYQQTPGLQPTTNPTSVPSPTPDNGGTLTVQITDIPSQVANGSRVPVSVNTGEPGASVVLVIRYNVQPYRATAGPQISDSDGNATLSWFVFVLGLRQKSVEATVYAVATDQNGQRATSQAVTVQVLPNGTGG